MILDTHVIVWWMLGLPQLSPSVVERLSQQKQLFVSVASVWECEVKRVAGRMPPGADLLEAIAVLGLECLSIGPDDAMTAARLPRRHRDPFDRMLIAHAQRHELTIVTHDRVFGHYAAPVLWA